jgi:hypothetical protein
MNDCAKKRSKRKKKMTDWLRKLELQKNQELPRKPKKLLSRRPSKRRERGSKLRKKPRG